LILRSSIHPSHLKVCYNIKHHISTKTAKRLQLAKERKL
jgi:hypothetical protein